MYECFHCLKRAVIWDADFDFSDFGYDGEGIVHMCHCTNCGAEVEYRISVEDKLKNVVKGWFERAVTPNIEDEE